MPRLDINDPTLKGAYVEVTLETTCRCGQSVKFGRLILPGHSQHGDYLAAHEVPHCATFERLDVLDYMRWLRTGVERMN
jgi:hypothetical protein